MQFKDVLVAPTLKTQLLTQVHERHVGHAQLFLAQPGSHAFALAVALSQYLCCEHPTETDSCGVCPSCIQFSKLSHPDLHLYFPNCTTKEVKKDPDSQLLAQAFKNFVFKHNYHIELQDWLAELDGENKQASINIRDCSHIIAQNSTRSFMGGYKIYILWNADRLHHAAAPKLLKTLEEPESSSLFILITEKPEQILSTILSRTQLVKIPRLTDDELSGAPRRDIGGINEETARNIALIAEGDYNKALQIFENSGESLELLHAFKTLMQSVMAFSQQRQANEIGYADVQKHFAAIVAQGREKQKEFLTLTLRMLRNLLMQNTGNASVAKLTAQEREALAPLAALNLKHITKMTDECNKALYHIGRNGNTALIFTDLYFKLAESMK